MRSSRCSRSQPTIALTDATRRIAPSNSEISVGESETGSIVGGCISDMKEYFVTVQTNVAWVPPVMGASTVVTWVPLIYAIPC